MTHALQRFVLSAAMIGALLLSGAAWADGKPFLRAEDVPLMRLLSPPPANDSSTTKAELAEVLGLQASRSEAQAAHAAADNEETVLRFLDGMEIKLTKEAIPLCVDFFQRISDTEEVVTGVAKKGFARPRPPLLNADIKPIIKLSKSGAYPSGHTTYGTAMGIILAEMLPEKRVEIFARIKDYGVSRMIVGVHYHSDLEAGHVAGSLIAQELFKSEDFKAAFGPAKAELRKALGV